MGVRQTLNDNPLVTAAVTGIATLAAIFIVYRTSCAPAGERSVGPQKFYFSIDDGKSYFAEDASKLPPFDYQGKPAYRVKVYRCADGKMFVSHLERYSEAVKKSIEAAMGSQKGGATMNPTLLSNVEVKRPGDSEWVTMSASGAAKYLGVVQPRCPDGSTTLEPVLPN